MSAVSRAVAALAVVTVVVVVLVLQSTGGTYQLTAEFSDVQGLVSGANVRLAGVDVGSVGRIWLGPGGWPRAQLNIDDDVSMRATGTAAVRVLSLSGEFNRYVSIEQGTGVPVSAGSLIPLKRTSSPVEVDQALGTFDPATRADLSAALRGFANGLSGEGPSIAATLRQSQAAVDEVGDTAGQVEGDGHDLAQLLQSADRLSSTLAARTPALDAAVDRGTALLETLSTRAGSISSSVAGLPQALEQTDAALVNTKALAAPATRLLNEAGPAITELPATATELDDALQAVRPALDQAADVATVAPGAARAFAPLLRAAGPLLAVMTPVLKQLGPMLDQARVRFPDAFSFFSNWADFTSNYDANGHAARVGIVLPPAPTNVLSPSSDGPGQLVPPYLRTPGALDGQPWTDYWKSFVAGGKAGPDVK
jgi:phospholipid/cholesterol/gamma-HCH transport system substrate-binding protein